jgi:hypothetical protein
MSQTEALNYPLAQAFALIAFHTEFNPHSAMDRVSAGYIAQEAARL